MINLKNNKGAITLYILVSLLFFIIAIGSVQANLKSKESRVESEYQKIKASYEKDASEVYANIEITIGRLKESGKPVDTTTIIEEDDGDIITIPEKFKVAPDSGDTAEEGIVVIAPDESEFVWVPVADITKMAKETSGIDDNGNKNYQGKLYSFSSTDGVYSATERINYGQGTTSDREPDYLSDTLYGDASKEGLSLLKSIVKLTGTDEEILSKWQTNLQSEYNEMIKYVEANKGFYVGRYETSLNTTTKYAQSISGETSATPETTSANTWYGLYQKEKEYSVNKGLTEIVGSSMIWGSQYDQMLIWMQSNGIDVTSENPINLEGTTTSKNTTRVTGSKAEDKLNNIYDLLGNGFEWTLEARDINRRVYRGESYAGKDDGGNLIDWINYPSWNNEIFSSRLTLYVKDDDKIEDSTEEDTTIAVESVTITGENTVNVGESITLTATVTPDNATNKTVTWTSGNDSIATIESSTGVVTGVASGTVTITATADGKSNTYGITVQEQNNDDTQYTDTKYFEFTYDETNMTAELLGIKDEYMPSVTLYTKDDSGNLVEDSTAKYPIYIQDGSTIITDLVIPSTVIYGGNEYNVTVIQSSAFLAPDFETYTFDDEIMFTSVVIPNTVTGIGIGTFMDQSKLEMIVLSDNIYEILIGAFQDCESLSKVSYKGTTYTDYNELKSALEQGRNWLINDHCISGYSFNKCTDRR